MMSKKQDRRYGILKKLIDSATWSYRAADGSDWSNIFWNWKEMVEKAGLNMDSRNEMQKAKRLLKEVASLSRDQMKLNGYKEEMPNAEINREVASTMIRSDYVLSTQTENPKLSKTKHMWKIDGDIITVLGDGSVSHRMITELQGTYSTYDDTKKATDKFVAGQGSRLSKVIEYSNYGLEYDFEKGSYVLIAIYPIGDEKVVESMKQARTTE